MYKLLDTHQHLIYRDQVGYSWTKEIPPLSEGDFTIDDYNKLVEGLEIGGTLFMETGVDDSDYKKESHFIKSLMNDSSNNIKGLILSIRPEDDNGFDEWLEESSSIGAAGYRRVLHVMPNELSQSTTFINNVKKIGLNNKPFDICYLPTQLSIALDFAKAVENTILVLNHCGVPPIASGEIDPWRKDIKELSQIPNVICKLSGLMAYCAPGTSSFETIQPYVEHVIECFGSNRILWGSDWPVVNLGKGLPEWINITRKILSALSEDEANSIANGTAQKIYKVAL